MRASLILTIFPGLYLPRSPFRGRGRKVRRKGRVTSYSCWGRPWSWWCCVWMVTFLRRSVAGRDWRGMYRSPQINENQRFNYVRWSGEPVRGTSLSATRRTTVHWPVCHHPTWLGLLRLFGRLGWSDPGTLPGYSRLRTLSRSTSWWTGYQPPRQVRTRCPWRIHKPFYVIFFMPFSLRILSADCGLIGIADKVAIRGGGAVLEETIWGSKTKSWRLF